MHRLFSVWPHRCPGATVTHHHKLGDLQQQVYSLVVPEPEVQHQGVGGLCSPHLYQFSVDPRLVAKSLHPLPPSSLGLSSASLCANPLSSLIKMPAIDLGPALDPG